MPYVGENAALKAEQRLRDSMLRVPTASTLITATRDRMRERERARYS